MAKNRINDLRDHLFATLEELRDPEKPMDLDRAKAVCEVSHQIIESAKVEVQMVKAVSGSAPPTGFFNLPEDGRMPAANARGPVAIAGKVKE